MPPLPALTNTTSTVTSNEAAPGGPATATLTSNPAPATHFAVSAPSTATAGTAFSFTVTALDASNATVTGYTGTVHFTTIDEAAVLPADSTLSNGVGTFSATLKTAGAQSITAKDTVNASITGTSNTITMSGSGATRSRSRRRCRQRLSPRPRSMRCGSTTTLTSTVSAPCRASRAGVGTKVAYPWLWSATATVAPYVGLYADYYFNRDDGTLPGATPLLLPTEFVHGLSARVTSGVAVTLAGRPTFSLGGELGGLCSNQFTTWSVRGRAAVPF